MTPVAGIAWTLAEVGDGRVKRDSSPPAFVLAAEIGEGRIARIGGEGEPGES
jgi:hypothetical protein